MENVKKSESPKKQRNREKIMSAAQRIFSEKGYSAATINEIARAANVNKCTLYTYYEGKVMLWYVSAYKYMESLINLEKPIANSYEIPELKLKRLIFNHIKWRATNLGVAILSQSERKELPPKLLQSYIELRDEYEAIFREVISELITRNKHKHMDIKIATLLVLGLANSINQWYTPEGELSLDQIADIVYEFIARALGIV